MYITPVSLPRERRLTKKKDTGIIAIIGQIITPKEDTEVSLMLYENKTDFVENTPIKNEIVRRKKSDIFHNVRALSLESRVCIISIDIFWRKASALEVPKKTIAITI